MNSANVNAAILAVSKYAVLMNARVVGATSKDGETIVAVLHDDHVFAAASSKLSPADAYVKLAARIAEKKS